MYQIEVKAALVSHRFSPAAGWDVTVDVDAMERARGGQHPEDKQARAARAEEVMRSLGARFGAHQKFGRADLVAVHPQHGTYVLEVEGQSSRQREQAMYSALGQTLLVMKSFARGITYGVAVPDGPEWVAQLRKVPPAVLERLNLRLFVVSPAAVREITSTESAD